MRTIDMTALGPFDPTVQVWTLADTQAAGERDALNSWHEPNRIRTVPGKISISAAKLAYRFPPLSLVVLEAHRKLVTKP